MAQALSIEMPRARPEPPIPNGRLGMMLLIGSECVLFASLISAYIILRSGFTSWPPPGTPRLTLGLSVFNTAVIVLSSAALLWSSVRLRVRYALCLALGSLFLALQALEFHHLYARGLTLKAGPYGALFFSLASCHGLHVLGGLIFLAAMMWRPKADPILIEIYWYFVTALWLVLFTILYIL